MRAPPIPRNFAFQFVAFALFAIAVGACTSPPSPSAPSATAAIATSTPVAASIAKTSVSAATANPVDFATQVQPFLATYCMRCHGANGGRRPTAGINFALEADVKYAAKNNLMYDVLVSEGTDHMPPRTQTQPSDSERAMIKQWLLEGAKTDASDPAGPTGSN